MKKIFISLIFSIITIGLSAQIVLPLQYDSVKVYRAGRWVTIASKTDTALIKTNQKAFSFNAPIFVNGVQLGSGGGGSYPTSGIPWSTGSAWSSSLDTTYTGTWNRKLLTPHQASIIYQPLLIDGLFTKSGNAIIPYSTAHANTALRLTTNSTVSTYNASGYLNLNGAFIAGSTNSSYNKIAILGNSYSNNGFEGISVTSNGGVGYSTSGNGLLGESNNYWGVRGVGFASGAGGVYAIGRTGIYATGDENAAGIFNIPSDVDIPVIKVGSGDTTKFFVDGKGRAFHNKDASILDSIITTLGMVKKYGGSGTGLTKESLPTNYNLKFDKLNRQYINKALTANITIGIDTVGNMSNASNVLQLHNTTGNSYTVYWDNTIYTPQSGSSAIDSFNVAANKVVTYLVSQFGSPPNAAWVYSLVTVKDLSGAPTQLSAPSVSGVSLSTTALRFSWSNITNNSGYTYQISTDNGSTWGAATDLATNTTSFDITGLSNGTRRDVHVLTKGNGTTYTNSAYSATANATTSALTTLSTPTLNTPTVISSTEIDLACAANISNNSGYDWQISRNGGSTYTHLATTATNTYTYNFTNGHADSTYYFQVRANGDLVTYNHSAYSAAQSGHTVANPTISSAYTSATGDTVYFVGSKAWNSSLSSTGLTTNPSKTISAIGRKTSNTSIFYIVVSVAFANGDVITANYTPGTITSSDGGVLGSFSGQSVTNNVTASLTNITSTTYVSNWQNSGTVWTVGPSTGFGYFISDQTFSGDFEAIIDMTDTYWQSGYNMWVGLDVSTNTSTTGYTTWLLSFATQSATTALAYEGSSSTSTLTFAQGDKLSLKRTGSTIVARKYHSSSWSTLYTYTTTSSATVRFKVQAYGDGTFRNKLYNPVF